MDRLGQLGQLGQQAQTTGRESSQPGRLLNRTENISIGIALYKSWRVGFKRNEIKRNEIGSKYADY